MAKTFHCRDGGIVCGAKVTGETDEEVLRNVREHVREKHGIDLTESKTLARYAAGLVREER
jgi:predicted small metal-binding protein